jgi:hypothetical protein
LRIPTGFQPSAQSCERSELPWVNKPQESSTLKGLNKNSLGRQTLYIDRQKPFRAKNLGADAISVFFDNYT